MLIRVMAFLSIALAVVSCGGGADGSSPALIANGSQPAGSDSTTASPPAASAPGAVSSGGPTSEDAKRSVLIAPTVPTATQAKITMVSTPSSQGPLVSFAVPAGDEGLPLLALDAAGEIRLVGIAGAGGATTLSAESTALALVRMLLGGLEPTTSKQAGDDAIRVAANYPGLLVAINSTLSAGIPAVQSPELMSALLQVASQVSAGMAAAGSMTAGLSQQKVAPVRLQADPKSPYIAYTYPSVPKAMTIRVASSRQSAYVANSLPIAFMAQTQDHETLASGSAALLPANTDILILTGLKSADNLKEIELATSDNGGFNLRIFQTAQSLQATGVGIGVRIVEDLLRISKFDKCDQDFLNLSVRLLFAGTYANEGDAWDETFARMNATSTAKLVKDCAPAKPINNLFVNGYFSILEGFKYLKLISDAYLIPSQLLMMVEFSKFDQLRGACRQADGQMINCAVSMQWDRPVLNIMQGSYFTPNQSMLTPLDASGRVTLLATLSTFEIEKPGQAVSQIGVPFSIGALTIGPNALVATDPVSGAKGRLPIMVVAPKILPAAATIQVGQTVAFQAVDANGSTLYRDSSSFFFTNDGTVLFDMLDGQFRALKPGTATVTLKNTSPPLSATVTVKDYEQCGDTTVVRAMCEGPRVGLKAASLTVGQTVTLQDLLTIDPGTCGLGEQYLEIGRSPSIEVVGGYANGPVQVYNVAGSTHPALPDWGSGAIRPLATGQLLLNIFFRADKAPNGTVNPPYAYVRGNCSVVVR